MTGIALAAALAMAATAQTRPDPDLRTGLDRHKITDWAVSAEDVERERGYLRRSGGTAFRSGSVLRVKNLDGRWISFRDRRACDANDVKRIPAKTRPICVSESQVEIHFYRGLVAERHVHMIERHLYEELEFRLLHRRSGATTVAHDVQPWENGRTIVALASCSPGYLEGANLTVIETTDRGFIRTISESDFCELDLNGSYIKTRAQWMSPDHLRLSPVGILDSDRRVMLDVTRHGHQWRIESAPIPAN